MVEAVSASGSSVRTGSGWTATSREHVEATARLARETNLVVHVVVPRAPGVVECAREVAHQLGLDCCTDMRVHSIRIRFEP